MFSSDGGVEGVEWCMGWRNCFWVLMFCACGMFSEDYAAELVFPGFPDWGGEAGVRLGPGLVEAWDVEWLEWGRGVLRWRFESGGTSVIGLRKEGAVVVTARPVFSGIGCGFECEEDGSGEGYFFRAAGFFIGEDREGGFGDGRAEVDRIELRWEDGAIAGFLLDLMRVGVEPGVVNIGRLRAAVDKRAGGMPWGLDFRRLVDDFVVRKLRVYSFRLMKRVKTEVAFLPGLWLGEYVLAEPLLVGEDGWKGEMAVGYHRFIRRDDLKLAAVYVDLRGDSRVFIL